MASPPLAERKLTQLDAARVSRHAKAHGATDLIDCIDLAAVVDSREAPADLITMNSVFLVEDAPSGESKKWTICYPEDADPAQGHISVLSPAGAGLLGLRVGQTATWRTPQGHEHQAVVTAVVFQPVASGDFTR